MISEYLDRLISLVYAQPLTDAKEEGYSEHGQKATFR